MMRAITTIKNQPNRLSSRHAIIALLDIGGATGREIAEATNYTEAHVSLIRNTPMFEALREEKRKELHAKIIDRTSSDIMAGDPVENSLKALAQDAVNKYKELLDGAESEYVVKSVADSILDRSGYKPHTTGTKVRIEVTEKMADRFERVMGMSDEPTNNVRETTVSIEEEVSS